MAFLFYLLGWIAVLIGAAWSGYAVYTGGIVISGNVTEMYNYVTGVAFVLAAPGLGLIFTGLLLLALGGALSRLDEIAYNTRPMN